MHETQKIPGAPPRRSFTPEEIRSVLRFGLKEAERNLERESNEVETSDPKHKRWHELLVFVHRIEVDVLKSIIDDLHFDGLRATWKQTQNLFYIDQPIKNTDEFDFIYRMASDSIRRIRSTDNLDWCLKQGFFIEATNQAVETRDQIEGIKNKP